MSRPTLFAVVSLSGASVLVLEIQNEALRHASDDLQICFDKAFIELLVQRLMKTTEQLGKKTGLSLVDD